MNELKKRPAGFVEEVIKPALDAYVDFFDGDKESAVEAFIIDFTSLVDDDMFFENEKDVNEEKLAAISELVAKSGLDTEQQKKVMARVAENAAKAREAKRQTPKVLDMDALFLEKTGRSRNEKPPKENDLEL